MAEIAANILSHSSCHPLAALGVLVNILLVTQGSGLRVSLRLLATPSQAAAFAAPPGAISYRPPGSEFREPKARNLPPQIAIYTHKEGGRLQNGIDNAVNCEIFGTHVQLNAFCLHFGFS